MMRISQQFWRQQLEKFLAAQDELELATADESISSPVQTPLTADELEIATEIEEILEELNRLQSRTLAADPTGIQHFPGVDPQAMELNSLGRFRIRRKIGSGGWGDVYQAYDPLLHRTVALKVPNAHALRSAEMRQRFLQETRIAAGLSHQHIMPVYEIGQEGFLCYLVAAFCRGGNLANWLKEQKAPLSPECAAQLILTLAQAVHHAHDRGVLHRDLKPSNI